MNRTDISTPAGLLACGVAAGPLYLLVGSAQVLMRDGFDMRRHALSLLSNGEHGWIQISNFVVTGLLVAGAIGVRRALRARRREASAPILLAIYGIGLLGAGAFVADPASGYPPGVAVPAGSSRDGLLHFVFGAIGSSALIAACFVFARRFAGVKQPGWAAVSALIGAAFFVRFAAIASGSSASTTMLAFYAAR